MSKKDEYYKNYDDGSLKEDLERLCAEVRDRQEFFETDEDTKEGEDQFYALDDAAGHLLDAHNIINDLYK